MLLLTATRKNRTFGITNICFKFSGYRITPLSQTDVAVATFSNKSDTKYKNTKLFGR